MTRDRGLVAGVDLGDRWSWICVLDEAGAVVEEARVQTKAEALPGWFRQRSPMRVALEVGTHSR
jgi:hypothetical protein